MMKKKKPAREYPQQMDLARTYPDNGVVDFIVPGPAIGKANMIPVILGKKVKVKMVKHPDTRAYMDFVSMIAKFSAPREPWRGAVAIHIDYTIAVPPSWGARKQSIARDVSRFWSRVDHFVSVVVCIFATVKPDGDNVSKAICDALSKVVYHDDAQIVDYRITKHYGPEAKARVVVTELEHLPTQPRLL